MGSGKKNAEEQIVNRRLKYLDEGNVWDETTIQNHQKVPEMVAAEMKKQQKHLAEAGLLQQRESQSAHPCLSQPLPERNILRKKGNMIFKTAQNFVRISLLTAH